MTSAYLDWKPGDKVECLVSAADWERRLYPLEYPTTGVIYTIRDIVELGGEIGLLLNEISNAFDIDMGCEPPFAIENFRKLVEREYDISIFEKMLRKSEAKNRRELVRLNEERGAPMELPLW